MNKTSTFVLRSAVIGVGAIVAAICILLLVPAFVSELSGDFDYAPIIAGIIVSAIPFMVALRQALRLLNAIDSNRAFSVQSVASLKTVKRCALTISAVYTLGLPYIFYVADQDDAPGMVAITIVIVGASFVVATFAAVLQRLLDSAIALKDENDLTV